MVTPVTRKPHDPVKLRNKKWITVKKKVLEGINDGLCLTDAFAYAGVPRRTYQKWRNWAMEDTEDGFTGTNLQNLMNAAMEADSGLKKRISKAMTEKAIEERDTRLLMYLGDNRLGYANKRKNQVELGSSGQNNVQINIIDMKSVEVDDEEEIEVHGECRDDSDSTEMD